jgi:hypothetical protein
MPILKRLDLFLVWILLNMVYLYKEKKKNETINIRNLIVFNFMR